MYSIVEESGCPQNIIIHVKTLSSMLANRNRFLQLSRDGSRTPLRTRGRPQSKRAINIILFERSRCAVVPMVVKPKLYTYVRYSWTHTGWYSWPVIRIVRFEALCYPLTKKRSDNVWPCSRKPSMWKKMTHAGEQRSKSVVSWVVRAI